MRLLQSNKKSEIFNLASFTVSHYYVDEKILAAIKKKKITECILRNNGIPFFFF